MKIKTLAMIMFLFSAGVSGADNTIILNTSNEPPNSTDNLSGIGDRVVKEAFRRIGVGLTLVRLPSERALINANEGIEDGNYARVGGIITQIYPNLIQVPEPVTRFEFVAFSRKHNFRTAGWESLNPYNIGIVTGWKILENNIRDTKSLTKVRDADFLFNMLMADRVDVAVYDLRQGMFVLGRLKAADVRAMSPPLSIQDMFIYLHRKHRELAPRLAEAIREMKEDGTYRRIVDEVLRDLP